MEHTPTPWGIWHYEEGLLNGVNYIAGPNGENISTTICMDSERQKADALHIVRCVNSHDALVEALDNCLQTMKDWMILNPGYMAGSTIIKSEKALKQAKGE